MNKKLQIPTFVWTIMKLSLQQIMLYLLFCGFSYAHESYGQDVLNKSVSIDVEDTEFKKVLTMIEKQTNVRFVYSSSAINVNQKVNFKATNKKLETVLTQLLRPIAVNYVVSENHILLKNERQETGFSEAENLEARKLAVTTEQKLKGTVTDEKGIKLPGVNILVKGSARGTVTDVDGKFELGEVDEKSVLVFSFVGYLPQEVLVGNKNTLDIILKVDERALDEVVVVGYGTVRKSDLTGAVSSVSASDINRAPVQSVSQALQGRAPGVQVTRQNGAPGSSTIIKIRGANSIMGGNSPLIIVDGFPVTNGLDSFSPNDVESIEILKDASATAIYGARASNGVVIVTTKKGRAGEIKIDIDSYVGIQKVTKKADMMNASEFMQMANQRAINDNEPALFFPNPSAITTDTDWQDAVFRKAPMYNYNVAISGGNQKVRYSTSANYFKQDGIVRSTDFEKFTLRLSLDSEVKPWLTLNNSMLVARSKRNSIDTGGDLSPLTTALQAPPTLPVYDKDGNYQALNIYTFSNGVVDNPLALLNEKQNRGYSTRIFDNFSAIVRIFSGLKFKSSIGIDYSSGLTDYYASRKVSAGKPSGSALKTNSESYSILNENILMFDKDMGRSTINAVAGYTWQTNKSTSFSAGSTNFVSDDLTYNDLGSGSMPATPTSGGSEWGLVSWLGRVNYSLNKKYLVTVTARADGASRFALGNKWAFFPSAAVAWRLSDEDWMKDNKVVSDAKIRLSVGQTGNQAVNPYQTIQRVSSVQLSLGDQRNTGYAPANLVNKDLKWETTTQYNAGFDAGVLNQRLKFSIDYYYKKTTNLLAQVDLPTSSGFSTSIQNIGQMSNQGLELNLDAAILTGKVSWSSGFNISTNKNKILALSKGADIFSGGPGGVLASMHILREGYPLSMFYGYRMDGLDENGYIKYKDLNNDGKVTDADRDFLGTPHPKLNFGFNNSLDYKGFELSVFLQGSTGFDIINASRYPYANSFFKGENQLREVLDYWTPENKDAKFPKPSAKNQFKPSDAYVENGSYLKLRSIILAYNVPTKGLSWLRNVQVYVSGQNLLTLTKYSWFDPEISEYDSGDLRLNVDNKSYPQTKTIVCGIRIGL